MLATEVQRRLISDCNVGQVALDLGFTTNGIKSQARPKPPLEVSWALPQIRIFPVKRRTWSLLVPLESSYDGQGYWKKIHPVENGTF